MTVFVTSACLVVLQAPIEIGSRLEPFVDTHLVGTLEGASLELGELVHRGPVLRFDQPWEGPFCGYATVIHDGPRYLLYYRGLPEAGADGSALETTCLAVSSDGVRWERPHLELFEVQGTRANNVVLADAAPVTHNFSPFLDSRPGVPAARRFKALGGTQSSGLIGYVSADGVRWTKLREEPVFRHGVFDSQNVSFWSAHEQRYLCYFRTWTGAGYSGFRTVSRTTSEDFATWTDPVEMGFGNTPREHLYTNQTHPYFRAPHVYVAIAARFLPGRQVVSDADARRLGVNPRYYKDCSDAVLMTSRGGARYDRTFLDALLRPGIGLENWVSRSNYPALGIVQTSPTEMSLYVNQSYAQPSAALHRYSMRIDGLASVSAGVAGGELVTKPLRFEGQRLTINFATSAAGDVRVEVQDAGGAPLPGYALADAVPQIGNELERHVAWKQGSDVEELAGEVVRLRFVLRDADLYALRFVPD
ncbi:MAG: hypothetical protein GY711_12745 [bacterium]|nr:hypothetical protein [bacterium]